jgi:drug/metabolite transporter (DMT)-like permease
MTDSHTTLTIPVQNQGYMSTAESSQIETPAGRTPLRVWVGLSIAVILDAPVQLIWKALMLKYRDPMHMPRGDLLHHMRWFSHQTRSWVLLALFACQFFDWIWVLGNADLSFAQPFTALSYVVVSACAVIFFHEHLGPMRVVGIAAILIGVVLVGSSEHRTVAPEIPGEAE